MVLGSGDELRDEMLSKLFFWKRSNDPVVEHEGVLFPLLILRILLAQSASTEVRRRFEPEGNVFDTIMVNRKFQQEFLDSYMQANLNFFQAIKPHIQANCRRVLDIGCGIGLLDLLIYRAAEGQKPKLYLFDKTVDMAPSSISDLAPAGFKNRYVFTASLKQSAHFLRLNGVAEDDINLCEVGDWNVRDGAPFDLVFSRKSWGFHYPLQEYLDEVAESMGEQGVVMTDVRAEQGGEAQMKWRFGQVDVLDQGKKSALIIARNPKGFRENW